MRRPTGPILISLISALCCLRCVGWVTAKNADPFERKHVNDHITMISTSAERRTVVIRNGDGNFCAEPPPDVSRDIASALQASVEAAGPGTNSGSVDAGLSEMVATNTVKLADRVAALDVYRTGTYVLCQYHLNGAMDQTQLREEFRLLTNNVTLALIASYKNNTPAAAGEVDAVTAKAFATLLNRWATEFATSAKRPADTPGALAVAAPPPP